MQTQLQKQEISIFLGPKMSKIVTFPMFFQDEDNILCYGLKGGEGRGFGTII